MRGGQWCAPGRSAHADVAYREPTYPMPGGRRGEVPNTIPHRTAPPSRQAAKDMLVIATSVRSVIRWSFHGRATSEVKLPRSSDNIHKVFVDPSGSHILIAMEASGSARCRGCGVACAGAHCGALSGIRVRRSVGWQWSLATVAC